MSSSISDEMLESTQQLHRPDNTPSLRLLIKFQRLLIAELYSSGPDSEGEQVRDLNVRRISSSPASLRTRCPIIFARFAIIA